MGAAMESREALELRIYQRDDLPAMVALDRLCFEPPFLFSAQAIRDFAETIGAFAVVAERGAGKMAGFAIGHMEWKSGARVGYCVTLDVTPGERRTGVGGLLLGELERWAKREGAQEMVLHVFVGNDGARRFYAGRGYQEVRQVEGFYRRELDGMECRKALG